MAYTAVQSQKAVSAYLTGKQILPFNFAEQYTAVKSQGGNYLLQQLLLFSIVKQFRHSYRPGLKLLLEALVPGCQTQDNNYVHNIKDRWKCFE